MVSILKVLLAMIFIGDSIDSLEEVCFSKDNLVEYISSACKRMNISRIDFSFSYLYRQIFSLYIYIQIPLNSPHFDKFHFPRHRHYQQDNNANLRSKINFLVKFTIKYMIYNTAIKFKLTLINYSYIPSEQHIALGSGQHPQPIISGSLQHV